MCGAFAVTGMATLSHYPTLHARSTILQWGKMFNVVYLKWNQMDEIKEIRCDYAQRIIYNVFDLKSTTGEFELL